MNTAQIVLAVIYVIVCIALILTILFQESSSQGLGALGGNKQTDTFYGKTKNRSREAILQRVTTGLAIAFAVLSMVLYLLTGRGV